MLTNRGPAAAQELRSTGLVIPVCAWKLKTVNRREGGKVNTAGCVRLLCNHRMKQKHCKTVNKFSNLWVNLRTIRILSSDEIHRDVSTVQYSIWRLLAGQTNTHTHTHTSATSCHTDGPILPFQHPKHRTQLLWGQTWSLCRARTAQQQQQQQQQTIPATAAADLQMQPTASPHLSGGPARSQSSPQGKHLFARSVSFSVRRCFGELQWSYLQHYYCTP